MNAEEIFDKAIEIADRAERSAYLDGVCKADPTLRAEVAALVEAHDQAGDFLECSAFDENVTFETSGAIEGPGTVIGRYKLLEKIGEGGMASVYMADQREPIRRRVALKVIKLGMDTKQVIARFEAERQALALMDHPNIAKVLDAGTTDSGRPYFVMELVRGVSITEFCDKNNLSTRERLELFISVCQAVHHAHQKGIIHRDIKPSNVMVTLHDGKPVAMVIDFGIAKATNQRLTEKTVFTRYAQMIGTPEYMSPEQAEMSGLDVDTRTDVFSLGVLLYELLTGSTPFDSEYLLSKGYEGLLRTIREEEPTRPSTKLSTSGEALTDIAKHRRTSPEALCKLIRTDLDWIVMKTLEKDRNRRYDSVSEFVADIKRHLNNEPVLAGPPSTIYRIRKFVKRRRGLVTAVAAVGVVVLAALVFSTAMFLKAERARSETELVSDFFTDDFLASIYPEKTKGQEVTVRYILDNAVKDIDTKLEASPLSEAKVRETIGLAYEKLGDYAAAEPHLQRVLQIRRESLGRRDPATLAAMNNLGWLYWYRGRYDDAEPLLKEAMETRTRVLGEAHPDTLQSMSNLGWLYGMRRIDGQVSKAMSLHTRVLEIGRNVLGEEHPVMLQSMCDLALEYAGVRQLNKAEALATKGLEISRRVLGNEHESTLYYMNTLAWVYGHEKRYDEAMSLAREALQTARKVVGEEHLTTVWALNLVGCLHVQQGHYDDAMEPLTQSVEISQRLFGDSHALTQFFRLRLVDLYVARRQYPELDRLLLRSYEIGHRTQGEDHLYTSVFKHGLLERLPELDMVVAAQYDQGQYSGVLATFAHVQNIRTVLGLKPNPFELALLAMSQQRLGHENDAQAALRQLRQMCESGDHTYEEKRFYEAEQLAARDDETLCQAWKLLECGRLNEALNIVPTLHQASGDRTPMSTDGPKSLAKALARAFCVRAAETEARGRYRETLSIYESALGADPNHVPLLDRLAWLLATCPVEELRNGAQAVEIATRACELSGWEDAGCINTLAAACAGAGDFLTAAQRQKTAIDLLPDRDGGSLRADYVGRLRLYEAGRPYHSRSTLPMVAWWKLDEVADGITADASGNGLDGRLMGDAEIVTDPQRGNVLSLGGRGYVDCGSDTAFDITGPITVAAWINVGVFDAGHQTVIAKGDRAWRLHRDFGNDTMSFDCPGLSVLGNGWSSLPGTTIANDARWHHFVGVYDGTMIYLYVDGELDASSTATGRLRTDGAPVFIGANSQVAERGWKGMIDDVRIYDYALSEVEIKALYAGRGTKIAED
jgi:serine/threonine protein kinase/tetratricopeptide (TPR) repeat protein